MKKNPKRVQILVDGQPKNALIIGEVPTLWGGSLPVVKIGKKEMTVDPKSIIK